MQMKDKILRKIQLKTNRKLSRKKKLSIRRVIMVEKIKRGRDWLLMELNDTI